MAIRGCLAELPERRRFHGVLLDEESAAVETERGTEVVHLSEAARTEYTLRMGGSVVGVWWECVGVGSVKRQEIKN